MVAEVVVARTPVTQGQEGQVDLEDRLVPMRDNATNSDIPMKKIVVRNNLVVLLFFLGRCALSPTPTVSREATAIVPPTQWSVTIKQSALQSAGVHRSSQHYARIILVRRCLC